MPISTITNGESGSSVRTKLNSVIGAVNAAPTDYATAAQGVLADSAVQPGDLGGAASLNVGTSAGTVCAGNDSRLSDARTPTAHASSHVNGTDAIQAATASVPGLATAAQITKLDGIEALADVTDAGNVGSSIDGAAVVTTLGDTDKLPVTQSGVLKAIAYSALKTLLNALYALKGAITSSGLTQATAKILGRTTASTGAVEELSLSQVLDMVGSAAQGDILYRNGTVWTRLAAGTSGKYLKTLGTGADPLWDTPAGGGGGKVLQMVYAHMTDTTSGSGTTLTNVMTCAITPISATSRIVMICAGMASASGYYNCGMALARAGTPILRGDAAGSRTRLGTSFYGPAAGTTAVPFSLSAVDEPATTSALTYSLQMQVESGTYYLNRSANDTDAAYSARGATSIILLEIAP